MSDRLTALDATFLELEQLDEGATMHIGAIMVFDPRADGSTPTIGELGAHLLERLSLLPRYSQRLSAERTGGLSWPAWEDDPRFDIANHLHRAALPAPGGDAELSAWAGEFWSHRLDRTRPLWEMALVEGLEGGRWALASKTHHSLVDGVGSVGVGQVLLDIEPEPEPMEPLEPRQREERAAGRSGLGSLFGPFPQAAAGLAETGARVARAGVHAAQHPREILDRSRALAEVLVKDELVGAPRSSINVPIGASRRYAVVRASLPELKAVGRELGGSVNDVILAACTAGLRRLLLSRGEAPPQAGLRAMVPMNVRLDAERLALGNRVSSLFVELPVAEPDPVGRLRAVAARTRKLKASSAADGATAMIDLAGLAPPLLHASLARSLYATRLFNVTITNVPGPPVPLYALGARMREVHPLVPLAAEHCIGIAIVSYDGRLAVGVAADRDSTPDMELLQEGIREGLAELSAVVDAGIQEGRRRITSHPRSPAAGRTGRPPGSGRRPHR